ncbi:hypothetical protein [Pseudotenacibaculum haliotis]|uniref:Uncharacterized protein n=1 Tax=Pseudotenacibaculum haliotis TaxID=1862138 RepID=A0ABW5LMX1_9FLAO
MFEIWSENEVFRKISYKEMRLKEALYRGMGQSYTIVYPNGIKYECKIVLPNDQSK